MSDINNVPAGFMPLLLQTEKGKQAAEERKEATFTTVKPRTIPVPYDAIGVTAAILHSKETEVTIPDHIKVRKLETLGSCTSEEKQAQSKGRTKKVIDPLDPNHITFREGRVRIVENREESIHYLGAPTEKRLKEHENTLGTRQAYCHVSDRFTGNSRSLPAIYHQEKMIAAPNYHGGQVAFQKAQSMPGTVRVDVRFEGIRVGKLGDKDPRRVQDPLAPTWFLYDPEKGPLDSNGLIPAFIPKGIDRLRYQANAIHNLIMSGQVSYAVFAKPDGEQFVHAPKIGEIRHCDKKGMIVPTQDNVSFESKIKKEAEDRYQVITTWYEGIRDCASADPNAEGERVVRDCLFATEAQAISYALECVGSGSVAAHTDRGVSTAQTVQKATVMALNGELDPEKYEGWSEENGSFSITRTGFAKLQPNAPMDLPIASRNRGPIMHKRQFDGSKIWMKAKSDHCSFSKG